VHETVGGEDYSCGSSPFDEEGHEVLRLRARRGGVDLAGVAERGLVAVVAIGDEQRRGGDLLRDRAYRIGVRHLREHVPDAVLRLELADDPGRLQGRAQGVRRIAVQHEARAQVRPRGAESLRRSSLGPESVRSWGSTAAGEKGNQLHEGEEAAARDRLRVPRRPRREGLVVAVERRLVVAHQDPAGAEVREQGGGPGVLRVAFALGEDEADDVVRIAGGELARCAASMTS